MSVGAEGGYADGNVEAKPGRVVNGTFSGSGASGEIPLELEVVFSDFNESKFLDQYITHGTISVSDISSSLNEFGLSKAYPNPFNPRTSFELSVPHDNYVSVKVYNLMGQLVDVLLSDYMSADIYHLVWDGSSVPSGVYLIRAENGSDISTQKIMLLK